MAPVNTSPRARWSDQNTSMCTRSWLRSGVGCRRITEMLTRKVVLPVGVVSAEELVRVLRGLEISRQAECRR